MQRKSPRLSQTSYNSRTTRNSKTRVNRDIVVLIKNSDTGKNAKVACNMTSLESSYNPDASGILSHVTSCHGYVEMPQPLQLIIESNCEREDSVMDNQDQDDQTHIIEDIE